MFFTQRQNFTLAMVILTITTPLIFADPEIQTTKTEEITTTLQETQTPENPSDIPSEIKLLENSKDFIITKDQFLENEQLLADLFIELEESEELKNLPPETPENFKHLSVLKEIYKFAYKQNPTGVKLATILALTSVGYLNYRFSKARYATAGIISSALLADFITTRYSYRKN